MLVVFDSVGGGLNVIVVRALRAGQGYHLLRALVVNDALFFVLLVHGLVVLVDGVRVAEGRMDLLLDDLAEGILELASFRVQEV